MPLFGFRAANSTDNYPFWYRLEAWHLYLHFLVLSLIYYVANKSGFSKYSRGSSWRQTVSLWLQMPNKHERRFLWSFVATVLCVFVLRRLAMRLFAAYGRRMESHASDCFYYRTGRGSVACVMWQVVTLGVIVDRCPLILRVVRELWLL